MPPNFSRNLILVKISDNRYLIRRGNRSPWPWHYIKTLNDVTSENHMFHFPPPQYFKYERNPSCTHCVYQENNVSIYMQKSIFLEYQEQIQFRE